MPKVSTEVRIRDRQMQQLKPLTLRHNFSWTFVGNVVYAGSQWGILVVLAKLGSPEMVGQFTLGLAVTAPVIMLTNLELRAVQATDARYQYHFGDYLGLRLILTGLALLLIAGITFAAGYRWETSLVILLVGLAKAFESLSDLFYGLLQQYERMDRIAISLMIKSLLSPLLLSIGVYLTGNVWGGVVGLAIAWALVLVGYDIRNSALILNSPPLTSQGKIASNLGALALQPRWHLKTLVKLVWLTLPLGFVRMLMSLNANIPRYIVEQYLGERELGIYAAIAYLMVLGSRVVSALGESASPRLAKYYAEANSIPFRRLLLKLVGIGALLGGVGVMVAFAAGQELLTLLYEPEYAKYTDVFVWLMIAAGVSYMSFSLEYGMMAARYFRIQMPLFASVTTVSAIACLWLIPTNGLQGAAIAQVIAAVVSAGTSLAVILNALYVLHKRVQSQ